MRGSATNRQKKVLRFFRVHFHPDISRGAAGYEIGAILSKAVNAEQWRKYLFLTKDFGSESDLLLKYSEAELNATIIPEGWDASQAVKDYQEEESAIALSNESPYDQPPPVIKFENNTFCFTGKFDFGPRKECERLIVEKRGLIAKGVSDQLDYLVIGTQGSPTWKRGSYGAKIERAIYLRRMAGKPAIVSESHCFF